MKRPHWAIVTMAVLIALVALGDARADEEADDEAAASALSVYRGVSVGMFIGGPVTLIFTTFSLMSYEPGAGYATGTIFSIGAPIATAGMYGLFGSYAIDDLRPGTGLAGDALLGWQAGLSRACTGAGWIVAGSLIQFSPLEDNRSNRSRDASVFQWVGLGWAVAGAAMMIEGYTTAERHLGHARPASPLTILAAAGVSLPKLVVALFRLSPRYWSPQRGLQELGWVAAGTTMILIEAAVGHRHRRSTQAPAATATRALAPTQRGWFQPLWIPQEDGQALGLAYAGRW